MGAIARAPVRVSGLAATRCAWRFLRDPLTASRQIYEAHGPFVLITPPLPTSASRRVFVLAAGPVFNRAVLGFPEIWRTVHIMLLVGPRDTPMHRLAQGMVRLSGERHAHYRRLLVPPLRRSNVETMGPAMIRLAEEEIAAWRPGEPVDLWAKARRLIRTFAIGLLFGDDRTQGYPIADLIGRVLDYNWSVGVAGCPVDLPLTPYHRMQATGAELEKKVLAWAACKRGRLDGNDLLSVVVNNPDETGRPPSDETIIGHVPTLFGAAYETCQNALLWTLVLLGLHPQVARDLHDELVGARAGGPLSLETILVLPLLDAVVKESMRILPPVPTQFRVARADTELLGHPLPRGARVALSAFLTNRLPDLYPEADTFRPARWREIDPSPFEYAVFSAGPRSCPGAAFGLGVVKTALATLLQRYRVEIPAGSRIDYQVRVALSPRRKVMAVLRPVDGRFTAGPVSGSLHRLVRLPA